MDTNPEQNRNFPQNYQTPNTQQQNSGLMRYRSAPSSYFSTLLDREFCEEFLSTRQSPETERILTRLISGGADESSGQGFRLDPPRNEVGQSQNQVQVIGSMKTETDVVHQQEQSNFSVPEQSIYHPQMVGGGGRQSSNLIRHSSSPAGLFNSINIEGFAATAASTGMGSFVTSQGESSFSSTSRFGGNRMKYSSGLPSSSRPMSPIAEIGNRSMAVGSTDEGAFDEGHDDNYVSGFSLGSWDNMASSSEQYGGLRGGRDDKEKGLSRLNSLDAEDGEGRRSQPPGLLTHHLSLPKTLAETAAIDNASLLQDSVLCKIRAKRGCATHPRSIAERVRRTKISERIRKLQDLVPNMDKQTNTADMLDLAVEYIKDLQKQVKALSEDHAKCTCQNKHQYL